MTDKNTLEYWTAPNCGWTDPGRRSYIYYPWERTEDEEDSDKENQDPLQPLTLEKQNVKTEKIRIKYYQTVLASPTAKKEPIGWKRGLQMPTLPTDENAPPEKR